MTRKKMSREQEKAMFAKQNEGRRYKRDYGAPTNGADHRNVGSENGLRIIRHQYGDGSVGWSAADGDHEVIHNLKSEDAVRQEAKRYRRPTKRSAEYKQTRTTASEFAREHDMYITEINNPNFDGQWLMHPDHKVKNTEDPEHISITTGYKDAVIWVQYKKRSKTYSWTSTHAHKIASIPVDTPDYDEEVYRALVKAETELKHHE